MASTDQGEENLGGHDSRAARRSENHDPLRRISGPSQHERAVVDAEVRRLVCALRPFGVLRRDALSRVACARNWHEGSFERALRAAIADGEIEELALGFYRIRESTR
jgi:hypothetical protein